MLQNIWCRALTGDGILFSGGKHEMTDHENGAEADMEKSSGSKFRVQDTRERSCKIMVDGDLDVHHVGLNLKRWRWSAVNALARTEA
jgi:hypothetical protein